MKEICFRSLSISAWMGPALASIHPLLLPWNWTEAPPGWWSDHHQGPESLLVPTLTTQWSPPPACPGTSCSELSQHTTTCFWHTYPWHCCLTPATSQAADSPPQCTSLPAPTHNRAPKPHLDRDLRDGNSILCLGCFGSLDCRCPTFDLTCAPVTPSAATPGQYDCLYPTQGTRRGREVRWSAWASHWKSRIGLLFQAPRVCF